MSRSFKSFIGSFMLSFVLAVGLLIAGSADVWAHQTKIVGDGKYRVIVGMVVEPPYTEQRTGLDLIIRTAEDSNPVEHLEQTLFAEIIAPDGLTKRTLPLRAQYGRPGYYTSDFVLTKPGIYTIRVWGMIYDVAFDEVFESHEVRPLDELRFP